MKKIEAPFIESFLEINRFLVSKHIRYCLIGGLAAGFWGEPRYTQDMDFTVSIKGEGSGDFFNLLSSHGYRSIKKGNNQIQVTQKGKLRFQADFILSETEYQEWVIQRAISVEIFDAKVPICTPEDLIILKLLANRRQDLLDVETVLKKRSSEIDQEYLNKWLIFWKLGKLFKKEFGNFL